MGFYIYPVVLKTQKGALFKAQCSSFIICIPWITANYKKCVLVPSKVITFLCIAVNSQFQSQFPSTRKHHQVENGPTMISKCLQSWQLGLWTDTTRPTKLQAAKCSL
ncbi:hypothetical protein XENTR_v10016614 [Xenopus tropicalis]|nr:hypothetical protein XENTR_v10016614 [Xenopus tropicalis]